MGHKADTSFFKQKRAWSRRKDIILSYYLEPYLAKVRTLQRPVLVVDGFAGPGKFRDGEIGSPLIICSKARKALNRKQEPPVRVWCIESDPELFAALKENVGFPFAEAKHGRFLDFASEIEGLAQTHTVFLYIDPFTAASIDWAALDDISASFQRARNSVEILLNFNTTNFVRWGLSALKRNVPDVDSETEDTEEIDGAVASPDGDRLSAVVGGDWWRDVASSPKPFAELINDTAACIGEKLRARFAEVCWLPIKSSPQHSIPKYHMFFGSRHPDALELMNDAMIKARGASDFQIDLFAESDVDQLILELADEWVPRRTLMLNVIRAAFCRYTWKDIRGRVESLLGDELLISKTGKKRINDGTAVRRRSARMDSP